MELELELEFRRLEEIGLGGDEEGWYLCDRCAYQMRRQVKAVVTLAPKGASREEVLAFHWLDEERELDGRWRPHFYCANHAEVHELQTMLRWIK